MSEWIKCSERMPEGSGWVIVAGSYVTVLRWDCNEYAKKPKPRWVQPSGSLYYGGGITHWMPLPPLPENTKATP